MRIRQEQRQAFVEARLQEFENYMVVHLNKWFPRKCRALGEDGVRQAIRDGINRAKRYGVVGRRDVARFIDMMFTLALDFDEDERFRWARQILKDESRDPTARVDRLCDEVAARRQKARGPR